jgi:outer membrane autotransporter protein
MSVADGILMGVAGGSANGTITKDNSAKTDTKTTYFSVYGSTGTKDWFADASLIYGGSSISTKLGTAFDTQSDTDARNVALYIGGGKEIAGKYLVYTPQVSLLGNFYHQDAYTEQASNAVARAVDGFDAFYLQSSVGGSMAMYVGMGNFTFKPELRAFWQHEWNAKEERIGYSLVDGNGTDHTLLMQAPEEDILKIGIGATAKLGEYLELRADLDTRQGKNYSDMTLLGSLRYQF